ncbi:MAG TPA: DUF5655 domain-containing protein [Vicinamibacterales bacterium]|nr:DUF5655 domain-containing protein [Vicinamibacterales bacterium]
MASPSSPTVAGHFKDRPTVVRDTYDAVLTAARALGPVREEPKKTSIHLCRKTAFAGVATRRNGIVLTLKVAADIRSGRVRRREHASAHRWHVEIDLTDPKQVDRELRGWIKRAYELGAER